MSSNRSLSLSCSSLLLLAFLATSSQAQQKELEKEAPDQAQRRAEYFAHQRGFEPGKLPSGLRAQAVRKLEKMRAEEKQRSLNTTSSTAAPSSPSTTASTTTTTASTTAANPLSSTPWRAIGPTAVSAEGSPSTTWSGRIAALAVDPRNSLVVYAGAADGGIWKTTDGGQSWTALTDTQASLSTGSIALDPSNPDVVYVGTGEFNSGDGYPGIGVLKSTDGGSTWTNIQGPFIPKNVGLSISGIAVSPTNPQIVLAAAASLQSQSNAGVFRSTDGGNTWTNVSSAIPGATAVMFDPKNGGVAYAGILSGNTVKLIKSLDSGATWSSTALTATGGLRILIFPSLADSSIYVAETTANDHVSVFHSKDGGSTFTELNDSSVCSNQCAYNVAMAVNPANAADMYFGGIGLLHSTDGGATWAEPSGVFHADQHAIAFSASADRVYVGNDGGMLLSTSVSAPSFQTINSNLATLQFYAGISVANGNPSFSLGGMQDNGTARYTGGPQWQQIQGADGFSTAIDPSNPNNVYMSTQLGNIWKSNDGGNTVVFGGGGLTGSTSFNTVFSIDRLNPNRLYTVRGEQVFQTVDAASNWTAISSTLTGLNSIDVEVAPSDSNVVWAAGCCGLMFVSKNAGAGTGATWGSFQGPIKRPLSAVAISPTDPTTAYVTVSGFAADFIGVDQVPGHVFKVTNSGSTWTDITSNLPDVPYNAIVIDPAAAGTLYVASDIGVFTTSNAGASWDTMVTNLPRSVIVGLTMDAPTRTLRAATHGRSMFDMQLPPATSGTVCSPNSSAADRSVTICAPANGATISSPFRVTAAAKDSATVSAMQIYLDGVKVFQGSSSSLDTTVTAAAGAHKLTIKAWDATGAFSSSISVTVSGGGGGGAACTLSTVNPSVTICQPVSGATVSSPVHLVAGTTDTHTVVSMKVYVDGVVKFTGTSGTVDTSLAMSAGTHKITVKAWDNASPQQVFSKSISVTVGGTSTCTLSTVNPSVTICQPAPGATVASPVHIVAKTTDSHTVVSMKVYVDGVVKFTGTSGSVDTSLAMTAGAHHITVKAWDNASPQQVFSKSIDITTQ